MVLETSPKQVSLIKLTEIMFLEGSIGADKLLTNATMVILNYSVVLKDIEYKPLDLRSGIT